MSIKIPGKIVTAFAKTDAHGLPESAVVKVIYRKDDGSLGEIDLAHDEQSASIASWVWTSAHAHTGMTRAVRAALDKE